MSEAVAIPSSQPGVTSQLAGNNAETVPPCPRHRGAPFAATTSIDLGGDR
jgi:hypothetical protein